MPSETVEERCIADLADTLEGIVGAPDYHTTVRNVYRMTGTPLEVADKPAVIVDHRGVSSSDGPINFTEHRLSVALMLTLDKSDDWETQLSRFIGDVTTAITRDHGRGTFNDSANALDTRIVGSATANLDDGFLSPVAQVDVVIIYRHLYGDPFNAV